jgi:hypothetical protein
MVYPIDECELLSVHAEILHLNITTYFGVLSSNIHVLTQDHLDAVAVENPRPYNIPTVIEDALNHTVFIHLGSPGMI